MQTSPWLQIRLEQLPHNVDMGAGQIECLSFLNKTDFPKKLSRPSLSRPWLACSASSRPAREQKK